MFYFVSLFFQVLVVCLVTGILSYPNIYTRTNASEVIRQLFSQCGPEDNTKLWYVVQFNIYYLVHVHLACNIFTAYNKNINIIHHKKYSTCM